MDIPKIIRKSVSRQLMFYVALVVFITLAGLGGILLKSKLTSLSISRETLKTVMEEEGVNTEKALLSLTKMSEENLLASLQDRGYVLANLMAEMGVKPLQSHNTALLRRYVELANRNKDVIYAEYIDKKGKTVAYTPKESEDKTGIMEIVLPIKSEGIYLGKIKIGLSKATANQEISYAQDEIEQVRALKTYEKDNILRHTDYQITQTMRQGIVIIILSIAVTILILITSISFISKKIIVNPLKKLNEATEKFALGDLDYRIKLGTGFKCWEIGCGGQRCTKTDCPAYGNENLPCWYIAGTMCKGKIQGSYADKIGDCRECELYKRYETDELNQLAETFNLMTSNLEESYTGMEEKVKMATGNLADANKKLQERAKELEAVNKKLFEAKERFRNYVENSNDIIYTMDKNGVFLYVSSGWTRILGHGIKDVVGKPFALFVHPDDVPVCFTFLKKVIDTGEPQSGVEYRVKHLDGTLRWHTSNSSCIKDEDGNVLYYLGIGRDITEQKRAEQALQESEERFRSFVENSNDIIYTLDKDGVFLFVSSGWTRILGHDIKDVVGKPFSHFVHPDDVSVCFTFMKKVIDTGEPQSGVEYKIKHLDDTLRWHTSNASCIKDEDGKVLYYLGISRDITEQEQVERALRESENRFRQLAESTSDWVWEVDENAVYTYASPIVKSILGYEPEEVLGKTPFDLMSKEEARRVGVVFAGIVEKQEPFHSLENANIHKDGGIIVLETSGVPNFDDTGRFRGYRGIDRDITERKKAEEEINKLNAELTKSLVELREAQEELIKKERLAVIGQLAGSVSHELRNPLGVIGNSIYYLMRRNPDLDIKSQKHFAIMEKSIGRATNLVGELLDYARSPKIEPERIEGCEILEMVLSHIDVPEGISLNLPVREQSPIFYANKEQVEQIIQNIVLNALQAMSNGGEITINWGKRDNKGFIEISDTGEGISTEDLSHIFEPLFTTKAKGTGLGLAICERYAQINNGEIEAESFPGKGSTFRLLLPLLSGKNRN